MKKQVLMIACDSALQYLGTHSGRERLDSTALSMLSNGTGMHTMFVGEIVNVMERK